MTPDDLKSMSKDASNFRIDTGTLRGHIDTLTDYIEDELWPKIEELEKRVIHWIPITERLPEKEGIYLVFIPIEPEYRVNSDFFSNVEDKYFCCYDEDITHWSELPAPPEEGKDA